MCVLVVVGGGVVSFSGRLVRGFTLEGPQYYVCNGLVVRGQGILRQAICVGCVCWGWGL